MRPLTILALFLLACLLLGCSATTPPATQAPTLAIEQENGQVEQAATKQETANSSDYIQDTSTPGTGKSSDPEDAGNEPGSRQGSNAHLSPNPWHGIPFDQFLEESWYSVMRRDPETLTELGLSKDFGSGR